MHIFQIGIDAGMGKEDRDNQVMSIPAGGEKGGPGILLFILPIDMACIGPRVLFQRTVSLPASLPLTPPRPPTCDKVLLCQKLHPISDNPRKMKKKRKSKTDQSKTKK